MDVERLWRPLAEEYDYDLYDDETVSNLQTAINQAKTHRNGAMRLRSTCLAGLASGVMEPSETSLGHDRLPNVFPHVVGHLGETLSPLQD